MKKTIQLTPVKIQVLSICLIFLFTFFYNVASAQTDTTRVILPDTAVQQTSKDEKKSDKKRKDEFIAYIGPNFNMLNLSAGGKYESSLGLGYHIGFNYKRGKFFYWQVGARFNSAGYSLKNIQSDSTDNFSVKDIDIPITGGINFLSATNRLVALRVFISAVPSFAMGVGENDFGFTKEDDINSFMLYGQGGIGVNVAFFVLEAGYNFGFQDLLKDYQSMPGQLFINLGFRF